MTPTMDTPSYSVSTTLSSAVSAGDTTLPVASTVGFSVGCMVEIEGGGNSETGVVASIGSLVLTSGLTNSYLAGTTTVTLIADAARAPAAAPGSESSLEIDSHLVHAAVAGLVLGCVVGPCCGVYM